MSPSEVKDLMRSMLTAEKPISVSFFFEGQPGVGKSSAVEQVARELKLDYFMFYPATRETVDLTGVPVPVKVDGDGMRTIWAAPDMPFTRKGWRGVLNIDELTHADSAVGKVCGRIFHERLFGDSKLSDGALVVATGNRVTDRAGVNRLLTHTSNRLVKIPVEVSVDDWLDWAADAGVHPAVRSYIQYKRAPALNAFDANSTDQQATPRSWVMVSDLLPYVTKDQDPESLGKQDARERTLMFNVVAGAVGKGAAAEFCGYCRHYLALPDPREILKDPAGYTVPKEPAVLHSLCGTLSDHARKADNKTLDAIATYALRLPKAFGRLLAQDSLRFAPQMVNTSGGQKLVREYRDAILKHRGS